MEISVYKLKSLLADAAKLGASRALESAGLKKEHYSKSEAYRRYGRKLVDRWIKDELVVTVYKNGRHYLPCASLEAAAATYEALT